MSALNPSSVVRWLGKARFERLGPLRQEALGKAVATAPDVATAAIWTLQLCSVMPTRNDQQRWEKESSDRISS